jgi:hypothetical protein
MDKNRKRGVAVIVTLLVLTLIFSASALAYEVIFVGQVNNNEQIVATDGTVYEVADNDMGNKLLRHVGKTVEVTGTVETVPGSKDEIIFVISFTILDE